MVGVGESRVREEVEGRGGCRNGDEEEEGFIAVEVDGFNFVGRFFGVGSL